MIRLFPPSEMLETTVERLPLSKSVAARVLVLRAIAGKPSRFGNARMPECKDIKVLEDALERVAENHAGTFQIDVADSGTGLRFMTAFLAVREGLEATITGSERLCQRPIAPLVNALRDLGADIEYIGTEGYAPLRIKGRHLSGGEVALDASTSSQYASALALIAPTMDNGLRINLGGQIPSMPYLKMTLSMLESRGIDARMEAYTAVIPAGRLADVKEEEEPDWSAASYWYGIAAVSAGWVTLPGLRAASLQGDSELKDVGERFGVVTEFTDEGAELSATPDLYSRLDMDMADWPDLVPALAVVGCLVGLPYVFTGVGNLRHKESDRLEALARNLAALGLIVEIGPDTFAWEGERRPVTRMPEIEPSGDHRIAMAFAVASLFVPGLVIHHPEVVEKSYPGFFDDLADAGFTICGADDPVPEAFRAEE